MQVRTALAPCRDIVVDGEHWRATSSEPWFEVQLDGLFAGRWIALAWEESFVDAPCRPVLRFQTPTGDVDVILAAAVLGRQSWAGVAPATATRVLISPVDRAGPFRWRLTRAETMSLLRVFQRAWRRSPARAALGLVDACVGLRGHADINFQIALRDLPLAAYPQWRARNLRRPEPDSFDRPPESASGVHVRFIAEDDGARLRRDLSGQAHPAWSVSPGVADAVSGLGRDPQLARLIQDLSEADLVTAAPANSGLPAHALLALVAAAATKPAAAGFYGDLELRQDTGDVATCQFRPGFDPLLLEAGLLAGSGVFWRVGHLRERAAGANAGPVRMAAVFRPVAILPATSVATTLESGPTVTADAPTSTAGETTVIIPTRDRLSLLRPCVDSVLATTAGPFRILIVDNDSKEPETLDYLRRLEGNPKVGILRMAGPFNFSRLCNAGASAAASPFLVFLNNDTTIMNGDWLERLKAHAARPDVGAVGAKLLFPSGAVQHAGVTIGLHGLSGHFEAGSDPADPGVFGRLGRAHQVSAVTGACLMIQRDRFMNAGGFDELGFPIDLNDIDLCLRLLEAGYRNVLVGDCTIVHHESASRGRSAADAYPNERRLFKSRWAHMLRADPHFHPGLSLNQIEPRLG
jgi:O-antigen biosynthesis protein